MHGGIKNQLSLTLLLKYKGWRILGVIIVISRNFVSPKRRVRAKRSTVLYIMWKIVQSSKFISQSRMNKSSEITGCLTVLTRLHLKRDIGIRSAAQTRRLCLVLSLRLLCIMLKNGQTNSMFGHFWTLFMKGFKKALRLLHE